MGHFLTGRCVGLCSDSSTWLLPVISSCSLLIFVAASIPSVGAVCVIGATTTVLPVPVHGGRRSISSVVEMDYSAAIPLQGVNDP